MPVQPVPVHVPLVVNSGPRLAESVAVVPVVLIDPADGSVTLVPSVVKGAMDAPPPPEVWTKAPF